MTNLKSDDLKSGHCGLQMALIDLIRTTQFKMDATGIVPQLLSTLPVLVDFPPIFAPRKPLLTKKQIYATAGKSD